MHFLGEAAASLAAIICFFTLVIALPGFVMAVRKFHRTSRSMSEHDGNLKLVNNRRRIYRAMEEAGSEVVTMGAASIFGLLVAVVWQVMTPWLSRHGIF